MQSFFIGQGLIMNKDTIAVHLNNCRVIYLDEVDSTNNYAKELLMEENTSGPIAIIANSQTCGRGRLGKSFASPKDAGIYLSIVMESPIPTDDLPVVTMASAVSVRRAIKNITGEDPQIKWVNDLFLRGKKICGILVEGRAKTTIDNIIIGIGVNCFPSEYPSEIKEIAGPISEEPGSFSRSELAAEIINEVISVVESIKSKNALNKILMEYSSNCMTPELIPPELAP